MFQIRIVLSKDADTKKLSFVFKDSPVILSVWPVSRQYSLIPDKVSTSHIRILASTDAEIIR